MAGSSDGQGAALPGRHRPGRDGYAATATFYQCVTGRPPFDGQDTEDLRRQHRSADVPLDPVPEKLRPLITRGMAKDPRSRPADAAAGGKLTATFNFFAVPSNPGVLSGSYTMTGTYSSAGVTLTQNQWISQPSGYEMVNISASPPSQGGKVLTGTITSCGTPFTLTRS